MREQVSIFSTAKRSALVAMSGGVDSTVAALLAVRAGLDCAGATIRLHPNVSGGEEKARDAAERLGIPFFIYDLTEDFTRFVIERFVAAYSGGRTPNPCVDCNKRIKFGSFLEKALDSGADRVITGHYARIERDGSARYLLKKGVDLSKDQSYVLYTLSQAQLSSAFFPLGDLTKAQARELAAGAGFNNADSRESQDICFVPHGDYAKFIQEHTGMQPQKGRFVDTQGNYLGDNDGVLHYTIGQRRGLGLAMPYPPYVLDIRPEDDTVVIGKNELLYSKTLYIQDINLITCDSLDAAVKAHVKIRYKHTAQPAIVRQTDNDTLFIEFDEPQRAITKGQAAVIYNDDVVVGGGTII